MLLNRIVLASLLAGAATAADATSYIKDNGVIRISVNDGGVPVVTSLWIGGGLAVPNDNPGADFQFDVRSPAGAAYNPTLGGNCHGDPSLLTGVIPNWDSGYGPPASNNILLGVQPRDYGESDTAPCVRAGNYVPFEFNFGLTLGDGGIIPKEVMIVDMTVKRDNAADTVQPAFSELPIAFVRNDFLRYAYRSIDGVNFEPYTVSVNGTLTNDTKAWPLGPTYPFQGRIVMLCDLPNALTDANSGRCMALYSNYPVTAFAGHRQGAHYDLTPIGMDSPGAEVTDFNVHVIRKAVIVGNAFTVETHTHTLDNLSFGWGTW